MRSMKVLVCVALVACVVACKKSEDDGGAGTGGASGVGGTGAAGTAGVGAGAGAGNAGASGMVASAGSGGGGEPDAGSIIPPAPPAIADLAAALSEGVCGALLDCVGPSKLNELVGGEDCETRVSAELISGELAYLQKSIDEDHAVLNDAKLDECKAGIRALACKIQTDNFPAVCEEVVEGKVAVGDECTISSDCEGTAFCKSTPCPSVCTKLLEAGDSCGSDEECGDDLICLGGKCAAPGRGGAECAGTTGKVCALGFACWNGNESKAGSCHSNAETLAGSENDTCEPGGVLCKEGMSCVYFEEGLTTKGFHCEKRVGTGEDCHQGLPGQCPGDEYCDVPESDTLPPYAVVGTCKARPGDGDDCVGNGVCGPHFVCVPKGDGGGLCRRIQNNGGACTIDDACRSEYCNEGVCESPAVCAQ